MQSAGLYFRDPPADCSIKRGNLQLRRGPIIGVHGVFRADIGRMVREHEL